MQKLPEPPPELGDDARREWGRVCAELHNLGLLTEIDRAPLAAYCQAYERWVTAERALAAMAQLDPVTSGLLIKTSNGNAIQNPLVGIANKACAAMVRYAAEFGMTPSARTRVANTATAEAAPEKLGKKELATEAAHTAGLGTDWGDDLTPSARIN
jgi:P27 family predicted phage terminase small subunit